MSNKLIYYFPECKAGDTILLTLSAFCDVGFQVSIIGDTAESTQRVYKSIKKEKGNTKHEVAHEVFKYEGEFNFRIEITKDSDSDSAMVYSDVFGPILDLDGGNAGFSYNIFVEDSTDDGSDYDYNDLVISLNTWRGGG